MSRTGAHAAAAAHLRHVAAQAAVAELVAFGHARGLFAVLAALGAAATCAGVAAARSGGDDDGAALDAGVVREWLDGLVVAGIVDHDGARDTYALPAETARALADTRALFFAGADDDVGRALGAAVAAGARGALIVVAAARAARVADNAALDPAALQHATVLSARALAARREGRAPLVDEESARRALLAAGCVHVRVARVDVGGAPCALVIGERADEP